MNDKRSCSDREKGPLEVAFQSSPSCALPRDGWAWALAERLVLKANLCVTRLLYQALRPLSAGTAMLAIE